MEMICQLSLIARRERTLRSYLPVVICRFNNTAAGFTWGLSQGDYRQPYRSSGLVKKGLQQEYRVGKAGLFAI